MKKFICLLLCLIMIIPAAVSTAAGDILIDSVSLSVKVPKAGETTATRPSVTLPSERPYELGGAYWITDDYYGELPNNVTFEAGKVYNIGIVLEAKEGYEFDCPTVQVANATYATDFPSPTSSGEKFIFALKVTAAPGSGSVEKTTLSKLKSVKLKALSAKKLQVSWKKLSSKDQKKIQKIEIQYSTDKTFKTGVKKKWAKKTKNSYTIKGLKKNTKYYVRIRAYKKSGNIIYVSKWVTKNKKTKKK